MAGPGTPANNGTENSVSVPAYKEKPKASAVILDFANRTETPVSVRSADAEHVPTPGSSVGHPVTSTELEAAGYQARRTCLSLSWRLPLLFAPLLERDASNM